MILLVLKPREQKTSDDQRPGSDEAARSVPGLCLVTSICAIDGTQQQDTGAGDHQDRPVLRVVETPAFFFQGSDLLIMKGIVIDKDAVMPYRCDRPVKPLMI